MKIGFWSSNNVISVLFWELLAWRQNTIFYFEFNIKFRSCWSVHNPNIILQLWLLVSDIYISYFIWRNIHHNYVQRRIIHAGYFQAGASWVFQEESETRVRIYFHFLHLYNFMYCIGTKYSRVQIFAVFRGIPVPRN